MNSLNFKPHQILVTLILSSHVFTISSSNLSQPQQQQQQKKQQQQHPNNQSTNPNVQNAGLDLDVKLNQPTNLNIPNTILDDLQPQNNISASLEQQEFLSAHNKARLHAGEPFFAWDTALALYAAQYAQKRAGDCDLIHSNGPYGENIFWGSGNQWTPTDVVRLWIKEHKYYNRASNSCNSGKICGHYTQIMWRNSVRLGCARVQCNNGDVFAICSYDPPGNYIDERPFDDNNSS